MTAPREQARPTQPLREEHQELLPHVEALNTVADLVGTAPVNQLRGKLDEVYEFLNGHLIPHAMAEDAALYPVVGAAMGAPLATATMSRDHVEVGRLVEELRAHRGRLGAGPADEATITGLRRALYGLYALVKVHFANEEEIYLPLLDERLTADDAARMFATMEQAAAEVKARSPGG
jgi:iron-sulfur cluster repair protein YtfE (RIC family)